MDSFTHIVLGAAIGEAVLGKKIGRKAMLFGALADTIPDFDVFGASFCTHAEQLMVHRGFSHSFLFVLLMSPALGWISHKLFWKLNASWKGFSWLFFWGFLSHIVLDSLTCYGTGWFEPFNSYRVAFDTLFVADPFYTFPFLICVLIAISYKNNSAGRATWTKFGLSISSLYLLFTMINKWHVHDKMQDSLNNQHIRSSNFVCTPTPLNNFLWMAYAKDTSGFWFGYYSIFDKQKEVDYFHLNRNESLLSAYQNDPSLKILKQFSKNYYCISKEKNEVYFNDIRFGQLGGWDQPTDKFVFAFKLKKNADNAMALDRSKFTGSYSDAFASLVNRIKGK